MTTFKKILGSEPKGMSPWVASQMSALAELTGLPNLKVTGMEVALKSGRVDILAESNGSKVVIENQYGALDKSHAVRSKKYALELGAQVHIIIAEAIDPTLYLKVISEGGILVITGVTENGAYLTRVDTNTTLSGLNIKDRFTLKGELNRVAGEELKKALMCINSVTELRDIVGEFNLNKPIIYRNQLNQLSSNVAYTSDRAIELKLLMVIGNLGLDRIVEKEVFKMAHIYLNARRSDVPFRTDYGFKIEGVIYTPKKKPWDSFTLVQKVLLRSISEMKEQSLNATPELRARLIKRIAEVTAIYNNNVTPVTPISSQV